MKSKSLVLQQIFPHPAPPPSPSPSPLQQHQGSTSGLPGGIAWWCCFWCSALHQHILCCCFPHSPQNSAIRFDCNIKFLKLGCPNQLISAYENFVSNLKIFSKFWAGNFAYFNFQEGLLDHDTTFLQVVLFLSFPALAAWRRCQFNCD